MRQAGFGAVSTAYLQTAQDAQETMSATGIRIGDVRVNFLTRIWDWLTYKPWTPEQLAERVAKSVANTCYRDPWRRPVGGPPVVGIPHHFTPLTDEEIAERDKRERLEDSPYS